jgi:hypothetical protein
MRALVDGDVLVYRCGFAAEKTLYTVVDREVGIPTFQSYVNKEVKEFLSKQENPEGFEVVREKEVSPLNHALTNLNTSLSYIGEITGDSNPLVFLSEGQCFRHNIATMLEYKGNRKDAVKPVHYADMRKYLIDQKGAQVFTSVEADDALALAQNDSTVIVTVDKDLLQVPGKHFNWVTKKKFLVTPEVGIQKKYQQVLTGDLSVDNIPGIHRCGPVTAKKILSLVNPTEEVLREVCEAKWAEYLNSDLPKPTDMELVEGKYRYTAWDGRVVNATLEDIVDEVQILITMGGQHAEKALREAGEEVPTP